MAASSFQPKDPFTLSGVASHLGNFTALGEIEFEPGEEAGSLVGKGVVVFKASNVTWNLGPADDDTSATNLHFDWADSVQFSDGTIVAIPAASLTTVHPVWSSMPTARFSRTYLRTSSS